MSGTERRGRRERVMGRAEEGGGGGERDGEWREGERGGEVREGNNENKRKMKM